MKLTGRVDVEIRPVLGTPFVSRVTSWPLHLDFQDPPHAFLHCACTIQSTVLHWNRPCIVSKMYSNYDLFGVGLILQCSQWSTDPFTPPMN